MGKIDYISAFYNRDHNRDSLIRGIASLLLSEKLTAHAIPFGSRTSLKNLLLSNEALKNRLSLVKDSSGVQLYKLYYSDKDSFERKSGHFYIYEHPEYENIFCAITIAGSDFYHDALLPFFQKRHLNILLTFLSHRKLKYLLDEFQLKYQIKKIVITRASCRLRLTTDEDKTEKIFPMVGWPNMDLQEAFNWVYQNNGWFKSLQFKVGDAPTSEKISLTRQGIIQAGGMFEKIFESFILPVCALIQENNVFFGNRSRRSNLDLQVKPLIIDFGADNFAEVSENEKFINTIKQLKASSTSVLHGNPYIHLSVIDYYDGSSFDLYVLSASELIIVPQMKGTVASIKRLINHIFDTYAEGVIKDYSEGSYAVRS
jgi:hypothetical protein